MMECAYYSPVLYIHIEAPNLFLAAAYNFDCEFY